MNTFISKINEVRDILRKDGITGMESITHCVAFYILRNLSNELCIKLIINDINHGAGKSRNIGIKKSSGDYIAFLDSDDIWLHNKIETQLKFMKENNAVFSHTSYKVLNKDLRYNIRHARDFDYLPDLLKSCDIGLSTVMLKKNLLYIIFF